MSDRQQRAFGRVLALAAVVIAGCAPQLSRPGVHDVAWAKATWPDAGAEQLEQGRQLYVGKCSSCHALKAPNQYPATQWPEEVGAMAERARISPSEQQAMLRYLITMARNPARG